MKKFYFSFLALFILNSTINYAQIDILFVDDSNDTFGNAELFYSAFEDVGFPATYYNAVDSLSGPSASLMSNFDLIVWHTSTQGVDLVLWNEMDEDNEALTSYLEGGGKLWLVGNDFLFDRYDNPPISFSLDDFPNKYLGITSYDLQSYGDDGGLGVPTLVPDPNAVIENLNDLSWSFPTLWWVDGVSLNNDAQAIYRMGDDDYIFADTISAVYHDNGTSQVLTYFFDLALAEDIEMIKSNVFLVMIFFDELFTKNEDIETPEWSIEIFPNPVSFHSTINFSLETSAYVSVSLMDIHGRTITNVLPYQWLNNGVQSIPINAMKNMANGFYFVKVQIGNESLVKPIVMQGF